MYLSENTVVFLARIGDKEAIAALNKRDELTVHPYNIPHLAPEFVTFSGGDLLIERNLEKFPIESP